MDPSTPDKDQGEKDTWPFFWPAMAVFFVTLAAFASGLYLHNNESSGIRQADIFKILQLVWTLFAAYMVAYVVYRISRFLTKKPTLEQGLSRNRLEPHGSAAYATIDNLKYNGDPETGIHFGYAINRLITLHTKRFFGGTKSQQLGGETGPVIYSTPNAHTLVCAPTRAGKTAGILIPTLLQYNHSVLAIDPKGELAAVTAEPRRKLGQNVIVLNPWGLEPAALSGFSRHSFNPLDLIKMNDLNAVSNATLLSSLLVMPGAQQDDFWNQSAMTLITGLILHVAATQPPATRTLVHLRFLLTQSEADLNILFAAMAASTAFRGGIAETGNTFLDMNEKTRSGVLSTARAQTDFLRDTVIKSALETSTFSLSDLKTGLATLYLVIPPDQLIVNGRWLRLMVGSAIKVFQSEPRSRHRCLFMLEEFPALGPMSAIETGVAMLAGFGVDFLFAIQNLSQLQRHYREGSSTFLANCAYKFFTAINDKDTADYVSAILGNETVTVHSSSTSTGSGGSSTSTSSQKTGQPLASPDTLMRQGPELGYLFRPGVKPVLIRPRHYHTDDDLKKLAAPNPFFTQRVSP